MATNARSPECNIALQLYTLRDEMSVDLRATLKAVKDAGYDTVETAFWPENISHGVAAALLRDLGLSVCAAHCALPVAGKKPEMLEIAEAFKCERVIWHGWPEDPRYMTEAGLRELTDIYNETNRVVTASGLTFGLHNHWWEFKNVINGRLAYELMLELLDENIFFEIDTYWVKVAGLDPAKIVADFGNRAPLLHVKDGPARFTETLSTQHEPQVALGEGNQNFDTIIKAALGSTSWMVVEMDVCATDVLTAVTESREYLQDLILKHQLRNEMR